MSLSLVNGAFGANGCSIVANGDSVSGADGDHNRHCGIVELCNCVILEL